ncbi:MAG: hypothetical protein J6P15_02235 [Fibrobacter sp.]|nr:hypothetical protein [Fibrobacter sp.]
MNKKILTTLAALSFAFYLGACGDDNSSSASIECLDNENCLDEDLSSSSEDDDSSSSAKSSKDKSSSSVKKDGKSSSSEKATSSSSEKKDDKSSSSTKDDKSSSSEKKDEKSSSSEKVESSSSEAVSSSSDAPVSSSSAEPESSSSVEPKVTYLANTPFAADLEVSGDTLFAVFQRYEVGSDGYSAIFNDPGLLAMYKLSDGTLLDTITLVTKNPQAVKVVKGNVYVGTQGEYNASWGIDADENRGIEKVDLKKKKSELWVSGTLLGGGVYMMDVDPISGKAVVAVYKAYQNVPVVEVDLNDKSVKRIDGVVDASGGIYYDRKGELFYIGDRGSIDFDTYEMTPMVAYSYNGLKLSALYDDEMGLQPAGIAVINHEVFVYISDFANAGNLYWIDGEDISDDKIQFSTDTKIVEVNGGLYVMDRKGKGSISKVNTSAKKVAWQKSIESENPYDIVAIDGSTAWVAMYNAAEIRKISLTDGSTVSSIDTKELSAKIVE